MTEPASPQPADQDAPYQRTLDLLELARVEQGGRVLVQPLSDPAENLFEKTLELVWTRETPRRREPWRSRHSPWKRFVPENADLRRIFMFAEALGSYQAVNDLINIHSPKNILSRSFSESGVETRLAPYELKTLEEHQTELRSALANAQSYLRDTDLHVYSSDELEELHDLLLAARDRASAVTAVIGRHYIGEVERIIQQLLGFRNKIRQVHETLDGIFLVDSEVMFIPTNDLLYSVETLFKAVGNPYVAAHIDGVELLAARNLLIEVVSFYSYYGKHQIYSLVERAGGTVNRRQITRYIRDEVHKLFSACKADNKLILTRVMDDAEREFEISVRAIQLEAVQTAVAAVKRLLPDPPPPPPPKPSWLRRMFGWLLGRGTRSA